LDEITWKREGHRHALASKGISTKAPPYKPIMPKKMYHGTDILSWNDIQKVGFHNRPDKMAKCTEPGYVYGTNKLGWAEVYAESRAKDIEDFWDVENVGKVILEIDLEGLPVEYDPTVALDCLYGDAFRVPLPIDPKRVKLYKKL